MSRKKDRYVVEVVRPRGVTHTQMCYFIQGAVQSEPGHYPTCNPLSDLRRDTVKVKSFGRVITAMAREKARDDYRRTGKWLVDRVSKS